MQTNLTRYFTRLGCSAHNYHYRTIITFASVMAIMSTRKNAHDKNVKEEKVHTNTVKMATVKMTTLIMSR